MFYVCYTQFRRQRVKASYGVNYVKCPLHLATCFHRHHTSLYILRGGEKFKHHLLCLQLHLYIVCIYDTLKFRVLFEPIFLFSDRHPWELFSSPVRWVMLAVIATLLHWSTHNEHPRSTDRQQCRYIYIYWHTCISNDRQLKYRNATFQILCAPIPIVVALWNIIFYTSMKIYFAACSRIWPYIHSTKLSYQTHRHRITHICVRDLSHHWFR